MSVFRRDFSPSLPPPRSGPRRRAAHGDRDRPTGVYQLTEDEVEALRTAIAPSADREAAVAAGRVDLDLCFDKMGEHFADPATFGDGVLDPADPEALVYADIDGTQQLVAVEWVSTAPGEVLGIPLHLNHDLDVWVLHAWVGLDNPSGMMADHHPDIGPSARPIEPPEGFPQRISAISGRNPLWKTFGGLP